MCEYLLEAYENADVPGEQVCQVPVQITYPPEAGTVDPGGQVKFTKEKAAAQTRFRDLWLTEDEI